MAKRKKIDRAFFTLVFRFDEPAIINFPLLQKEIIAALNAAAKAGKLGSSEFLVGYDPTQGID